jgi:hypothetical protein
MEEELRRLQEAPPSIHAKQAHMAHYLRDNAYYTLRDMDLNTFTSIFPPMTGREVETDNRHNAQFKIDLRDDFLDDPFSLKGVGVADGENIHETRNNHTKKRRRSRSSQNLTSLHNMAARVTVAGRAAGRVSHGLGDKFLAKNTVRGIFARQKNAAVLDEHSTSSSEQNVVDKNEFKADILEIETMSVDSIDNIITSDTRYYFILLVSS